MTIPARSLHFKTREQWRTWLMERHASEKETWLAISRKQAATPGVFYEDAVEEALCFGWIDGVMRSATSEFFYLRFSPRKRCSVWSMSNQKRVKRLIAQGRMTEAGMALVKAAKENGEWREAISREDTSNLPEYLVRALKRNAKARANFEKFPASYKKQLIYWISSAKTEKIRAKRIKETVKIASNNKRSA